MDGVDTRACGFTLPWTLGSIGKLSKRQTCTHFDNNSLSYLDGFYACLLGGLDDEIGGLNGNTWKCDPIP